jgi:hypothetical protein
MAIKRIPIFVKTTSVRVEELRDVKCRTDRELKKNVPQTSVQYLMHGQASVS